MQGFFRAEMSVFKEYQHSFHLSLILWRTTNDYYFIPNKFEGIGFGAPLGNIVKSPYD